MKIYIIFKWLNSQISIFSGMYIPFIILGLGIFLKILNGPWWWQGFIVYLISLIFISMKYQDKYTDEKYLEMSKKEIKRKNEKIK